MKAQPLIGTNRTGAMLAPDRAQAMIEAAVEFPPSSDGDETGIAQVRAQYWMEGEPAGTLPPPSSLKGLAKTAAKALTARKPNLLLDKLGERLAFERSGTRLYEGLIAKYDAAGSFDGGPSREELEHIREEELAHFDLLRRSIARMGGDPTAVTPSANLHAVASKGLFSIVSDPRTDLMQCLEAALLAELEDNDCWTALSELARNAGEEDDALKFEQALLDERDHLEMVRTWLAAGQGRSVKAVQLLSEAEKTATSMTATTDAPETRATRAPLGASARPKARNPRSRKAPGGASRAKTKASVPRAQRRSRARAR